MVRKTTETNNLRYKYVFVMKAHHNPTRVCDRIYRKNNTTYNYLITP